MRVRGCDATVRWAILAFSFAAASFAAQAQQFPLQPGAAAHPVLPGSSQTATGSSEDDPLARHMSAQLAKTRNSQRQQQLVADTAKLLELATDLKAEVDKSNKDTLSLAVVKKAEEIEKLAKTVKEKMRDAQ
jgi:hypothetical protein